MIPVPCSQTGQGSDTRTGEGGEEKTKPNRQTDQQYNAYSADVKTKEGTVSVWKSSNRQEATVPCNKAVQGRKDKGHKGKQQAARGKTGQGVSEGK